MRGIYWGVISLIIICLLAGLIYYSINRPTTEFSQSDKESLARCLTQKGIILHGTIDCPNCEVQKDMFGEAKEFLTYVNCYTEKEKCDTSERTPFPYWKGNNQTIRGPTPLKYLKERTGC